MSETHITPVAVLTLLAGVAQGCQGNLPVVFGSYSPSTCSTARR